ncbi:MAG: hypothetical protein M3436_04995 [Pseudomonadota bacterium]|nr:hypothetical protein [Pseudomonadota bacterium]
MIGKTWGTFRFQSPIFDILTHLGVRLRSIEALAVTNAMRHRLGATLIEAKSHPRD